MRVDVPLPATQVITLNEVLQRVTRQHPLTAAAAERLEAAKGARRTAGSLGNPSFTYAEENAGFPGRSAPAGMTRQISTFLTLPLEPLYQRGAMSGQASGMVDAAAAELAAAGQRLALDAARAFYRLAAAQTALSSGDDVRLWLDSLVRYTGARVREGAAAELDLLRLQVERDRAEADYAASRVELRRAQADLAAFAGEDSLVADVTMRLSEGSPLPPREQLIAIAMVQRPELRAAHARVRSAEAARRLQQMTLVREVSGVVGSMSTAGVRAFMAGVTVPVPVFNRNRGEVQRTSAELRVVQQDVVWAERGVVAQITGAYDAVVMLSEHLGRLDAGFLQRAEDARRLALGAFREGASPLLLVLDAARSLADARETYYRTLFAQQQSILELRASVGSPGLDALAALGAARSPSPALPRFGRNVQ